MSLDIKKIENDIEQISATAREAFFSEQSFSKSITIAKSIDDLRLAVDPMLPIIMKLMNTSLGFRMDRDPALPVKQGEPKPEPYSKEVVREVFIEATLRGFYMVNNEVNIIASRFYGALNGFERIVRSHKNISDFKDIFGVPTRVGDDGAIVKCKAIWKQKSSSGKFVQQEIEREFPIRVNRGMGADAILGKSKRKLYAAVYSRLTGVITPDGDATDVSDLKSAAPQDKTAKDLFEKK
jgi:hypothetical protein